MQKTKRLTLRLVGLVAALAVVPLAHATVPGEVNFQGLLLDDLGAPVTATVAMDFELFDAATAGTSLWTESQPAVQVVDGVYNVMLGETTPLTAALVAGGSLHLEVTVDSEILAPRQQLLVVPYALRSAVAENAEQVDGFDASFMTEMIQHFSFDGEAPDNLDPREGLADTDADGLANFVDADNDNDGLSDGFEISQGSDINLETPTITGFSPTSVDGFVASTVQVQGTEFVPGLTVAFGSQNPTPTNITSTSFDVLVGPQPEGTVNVNVTLPNAESGAGTFDFFFLVPQIDSFSPRRFDQGQAGTVTVFGQNFLAGMTVAFGGQNPTPTNITPTSFDVSIAGTEPSGFVSVTVTLPNGKDGTNGAGFEVSVGSPRVIFTTSTLTSGNLGGLAGADATCNSLALAADLEGTFQAWLADSTQSPSTRESQVGAPYVRSDGATVVADDWTDLTDGDIDVAVLLDENGTSAGATNFVWTNVAAIGAGAESPTAHCVDWTSASGAIGGRRGMRNSVTSTWTEVGTGGFCNTVQRLYCVEQ